MQQVPRGDILHPWLFLMVESVDGVTGLVGAAFTLKDILIPGAGALTACLGVVTEIGKGLYSYLPDITEVSTAGIAVLHMEATNGNPSDTPYQIGYFDILLTEAGESALQNWRYTGSATHGTSDGFNTGGPVEYRAVGDPTTVRITAVVDQFGDRKTIALS